MSNQTDSSPDEKNEPAIIIYCKEWCDYLRKLVHLLQEKDYAFTLIDLRFDTRKAKGLVSKLGNPLILPVIYINDQYYERPVFSKINKAFNLSHSPAKV
jgi:glutaredoxin